MGLSNAERQKRWRDRRTAEIAELKQAKEHIARLQQRLAELESRSKQKEVRYVIEVRYVTEESVSPEILRSSLHELRARLNRLRGGKLDSEFSGLIDKHVDTYIKILNGLAKRLRDAICMLTELEAWVRRCEGRVIFPKDSRRRKVEALALHGATEGERAAARAALERLGRR
jgi:hypothetical protein